MLKPWISTWLVELLNIFVDVWLLRILWLIECSKTQFIWNSKAIIIMLQKISISIDFSHTPDDDILLIPVEVML